MASSSPHSVPPPPSSPLSGSNSDDSATANPAVAPPAAPKVEAASENGNTKASEERPDLSHFDFLDSAEYRDKVKKYEADFTCRLMMKYFSNKNFYGGNIFDEKSTIDDQTIMSSKWHCAQTFVDPAKVVEEQNSNGSTSTSET
uniref:Proline-rich protein 11 n=1 Tax=Rhizophora mucronata TaxID=61149 RepID=A0A2P2IIU8_RHIMU